MGLMREPCFPGDIRVSILKSACESRDCLGYRRPDLSEDFGGTAADISVGIVQGGDQRRYYIHGPRFSLPKGAGSDNADLWLGIAQGFC